MACLDRRAADGPRLPVEGERPNEALERTAPGSGRIGIAAPPLSAVFDGQGEMSGEEEGRGNWTTQVPLSEG